MRGFAFSWLSDSSWAAPVLVTDTIFELLGGARMSSSYLVYSLSHVSCPYASSVVAVPALIVGGARIKVKKFQSTSKMNERSKQVAQTGVH